MQLETAHTFTRVRLIWMASVAACVLWLASGCGNVLYTIDANRAASKLEEAKQAGAERTALYEYTLAQAHLTKAMSEASEADYGDAYELARRANEYAEQAVSKARLRMRLVSSSSNPEPNAPRTQPNETSQPDGSNAAATGDPR